MKKRIIFLLLVVSLCCQSFAQRGVENMLATLNNKRVSLDYSFSTTGKTALAGSGTITINGNFYKSSGNGLDIFCDGSTRWTVDTFAKEVYVEKASGTTDFLSNPETFLDNVTTLSVDSKIISGTWKDPANDAEARFSLSKIKESELTEDASEFTFDVSSLGPEWVVTDLR